MMLSDWSRAPSNQHQFEKLYKIPAGQTASGLIKELTPIHMLQQMSGKTNDGVIFDSEANPMTTMYMGGAFDSLGLNTGLFGKK